MPLHSSGGIFCLGVVKYLEIFQKDDVWGCSVLRKRFHFVFFSCWSLVKKFEIKGRIKTCSGSSESLEASSEIILSLSKYARGEGNVIWFRIFFSLWIAVIVAC